jgi:hypothetical protein
MATTPSPPVKPATPAAPPPAPAPPAAKVEGAKAKPEPDPPVKTIADEQRQRSDEVAAEGVEKVKARLDQRDPKDRPRAVAGVSPTQVDPNRR